MPGMPRAPQVSEPRRRPHYPGDAAKFRAAPTQSGQGRVLVGFSLSVALKPYAALLRESGRHEETEVVGALAAAWGLANDGHSRRA
jgi:hypothetical protein